MFATRLLALLALASGLPALSAGPPVYVVLFESPGCPQCEEGVRLARETLESLAEVEIVAFDTHDPETTVTFDVLALRAGLRAEELTVSPSLFVERTYVDLRNAGPAEIIAAVAPYRDTGTGRYWDVSEEEERRATTSLLQRFQGFGYLTVLVAGLLDGVNPCAFATIVFLLSYLAHLGRSRREALFAGLLFTAGIFVPYFLLGAGLVRVSDLMRDLPLLRRVVTEALAAGALVLALLSFVDFWRARSGRADEIVLRLPRLLRHRVHEVVRESARGTVLLGSFGAGAVVALLEAACTGQIYLPTIAYVAGIPSMRTAALSYLVVYNLAFVAPLIGIIVAAYFGLSSRAAARLAERNVPRVKLLMAALFLVLAVGLHLSAA